MAKEKQKTAGRFAPDLPAISASTLVREMIDGRDGRPVLGVFRLAGLFDLSPKAVTIWREGRRMPRDLYLPRLQVVFVRYCLPEARAMIASFIPWAERNGLDRGRGLDTLVRIILDVAAANEGCARCVYSRAAEKRTTRPFLDRECAAGRTPDKCSPRFFHPDLLSLPWRGPDRFDVRDVGEV